MLLTSDDSHHYFSARASFVQLKYPTLGPPFSHSLRTVCTVLLDPRDPLLHSERTQGFTADPDYWKGEVFAYVESTQNLKDLNDHGLLLLISNAWINHNFDGHTFGEIPAQ